MRIKFKDQDGYLAIVEITSAYYDKTKSDSLVFTFQGCASLGEENYICVPIQEKNTNKLATKSKEPEYYVDLLIDRLSRTGYVDISDISIANWFSSVDDYNDYLLDN